MNYFILLLVLLGTTAVKAQPKPQLLGTWIIDSTTFVTNGEMGETNLPIAPFEWVFNEDGTCTLTNAITRASYTRPRPNVIVIEASGMSMQYIIVEMTDFSMILRSTVIERDDYLMEIISFFSRKPDSE